MVGATATGGGGYSQDLRRKHLWVGLEEGNGQLKSLGTGKSQNCQGSVDPDGVGKWPGRVRGGNVVSLEEHEKLV